MKALLISTFVGLSIAFPSLLSIRSSSGGRLGQGDCSPNPDGAAPLPSKTKWEAFLNYEDYPVFAKHASVPNNYTLAFKNYNATVVSPSYLGVHPIHAYDAEHCADYCNVHAGCKAFNIYISRDPSKDPGPQCANPPATANFKCAFYSEHIDADMATNEGQILPPADRVGQEFVVKHKGSNGYNKHPVISPLASGTESPSITLHRKIAEQTSESAYATTTETETVTLVEVHPTTTTEVHISTATIFVPTRVYENATTTTEVLVEVHPTTVTETITGPATNDDFPTTTVYSTTTTTELQVIKEIDPTVMIVPTTIYTTEHDFITETVPTTVHTTKHDSATETIYALETSTTTVLDEIRVPVPIPVTVTVPTTYTVTEQGSSTTLASTL